MESWKIFFYIEHMFRNEKANSPIIQDISMKNSIFIVLDYYYGKQMGFQMSRKAFHSLAIFHTASRLQ